LEARVFRWRRASKGKGCAPFGLGGSNSHGRELFAGDATLWSGACPSGNGFASRRRRVRSAGQVLRKRRGGEFSPSGDKATRANVGKHACAAALLRHQPEETAAVGWRKRKLVIQVGEIERGASVTLDTKSGRDFVAPRNSLKE